jgi:RNA polymerase sigma-70 factor, ECF subfamily
MRDEQARASEARRVLLAQSGDRQALDELLKSIQLPLFRYLQGLGADTQSAKDLLQETFILIYRKLALLREPELFRAWAYRIANRLAMKRFKKKALLEAPIDEVCDEALQANPEASYLDLMEVDRVLPKISATLRNVLHLHYWEGFTLGEIAAVLEIPEGTVKSRLNYGIASLRKLLK